MKAGHDTIGAFCVISYRLSRERTSLDRWRGLMSLGPSLDSPAIVCEGLTQLLEVSIVRAKDLY